MTKIFCKSLVRVYAFVIDIVRRGIRSQFVLVAQYTRLNSFIIIVLTLQICGLSDVLVLILVEISETDQNDNPLS